MVHHIRRNLKGKARAIVVVHYDLGDIFIAFVADECNIGTKRLYVSHFCGVRAMPTLQQNKRVPLHKTNCGSAHDEGFWSKDVWKVSQRERFTAMGVLLPRTNNFSDQSLAIGNMPEV